MTDEQLQKGQRLRSEIDILKIVPTHEKSRIGDSIIILAEYVDTEAYKKFINAKIEALEKEYAAL